MIQDLFIRFLEISFPVSICIVLVLMLAPLLEKKYSAKLMYGIWLFLLIRLLIPFNMTLEDSPLQIDGGQVIDEINIGNLPLFPMANQEQVSIEKGNDENPKRRVNIVSIASNLWAVGAMGVALYTILQYLIILMRYKRKSKEPSPGGVAVLRQVKEELGIHHRIGLRVMNGISSPMLISLQNPTIILPNKTYSQVDLYLVIKHEIIHYKRRDLFIKVLMLVTKSLYWFNPLIHIMINRFNQVMEMTCDELVIKNNQAIKRRYIETLLAGLEVTQNAHLLTSNYNGGMMNMKKRFTNIAYSNKKRKGTKAMVLGVALLLTMTSFVGCSLMPKKVREQEEVTYPVANEEVKDIQVEEKVTEQEVETEGMFDGNIIGVESLEDDEFIKAAANAYMEFGEEESKATRYYYNRVDLNNDGEDEAIVVLMGMYTSGSGGSTALIMKMGENSWHVTQELTLIQTPVIISENVVNDWHEIITYRSGGGAEGTYVVLTATDGQYTSVNDGKAIESLENVFGTAIINNDIVKELEDGTAMYLK